MLPGPCLLRTAEARRSPLSGGSTFTGTVRRRIGAARVPAVLEFKSSREDFPDAPASDRRDCGVPPAPRHAFEARQEQHSERASAHLPTDAAQTGSVPWRANPAPT